MNNEIGSPFVTQPQIMASSKLKIELSELPNKEFGSVPKNIPEIFRFNNYTFWQY
jgi:hypothetical protein